MANVNGICTSINIYFLNLYYKQYRYGQFMEFFKRFK